MSAFYSSATERAAAGTARRAARKLAAALNVTIAERFDGGWHELILTAPPRSTFAVEGLHELVIANAASTTDGLWTRALARLTGEAIEPCTVDACEWCDGDEAQS